MYILLFFGSILLFSGCTKEDFMSAHGALSDGQPTRLTLNLSGATMGNRARTRVVPDEKENEIENLRVMIFNNETGRILTNVKPDPIPAFDANGKIRLSINTVSAQSASIYVIANVGAYGNATVDAALAKVQTKEELEQLEFREEPAYIVHESKPLPMSGKLPVVPIKPGQSVLNDAIQLEFVSAKVTLIVKDKTSVDQQVTILGWDVQDLPTYYRIVSGVISDPDKYGNQWVTSNWDMPFKETGTDADGVPQVKQSLYVFANHAGGRVNRELPAEESKRYAGMSFKDTDHRGKGWFKPDRATAVVITAMHKTATETKQVKAHIYLGADNHSDYNILRGCHYTFTVTVNGLNDINVDSNIEYTTGDFKVDYGDNLTMDAHPDFRPMRIHAPQSLVTMEILDSQDRTHDQAGFDATWLKISPLNLMYHQVKQADATVQQWQQDANPTSRIVRGRYIPHTSVRKTLPADKQWWTGISGISVVDNDDDVMTFADATYRMCYKITDIPFTDATAITNKTLCVYADEYLVPRGNPRRAKIRFTFYKEGGDPAYAMTSTFEITQDGYISPFDAQVADAGLYLLNADGTSGNAKKVFVAEGAEEADLVMNPGISLSLQKTTFMQWGFVGTLLHGKPDKYRNGKFLTANAVYRDVTRVDNEPAGFGTTPDSYREMYGDRVSGSKPIPAYTGDPKGPYYYPNAAANIYHPIYKSSVARHCHEKNRDVNGDGVIDESEAHWYLPAVNQLYMLWLGGAINDHEYWSATEINENNSIAVTGDLGWANFYYKPSNSSTGYFNTRARCVRDL